jgi:ubiquitin carboxyl-terminal hydrolase 4/11/15
MFMIKSNSWIDYVIQDSAGVTTNGSHQHEFGSNTPRRPGAIDNTDLLDDVASEVSSMDIELHDTLVEGRDYILLPQQVWEKLHGWYVTFIQNVESDSPGLMSSR